MLPPVYYYSINFKKKEQFVVRFLAKSSHTKMGLFLYFCTLFIAALQVQLLV